MNLVRSSWSFTEEIAEEFPRHIRENLCFYDRLQQMIASLSDYFIYENARIYDFGCGTGETLFLIHERHLNKKLLFYGVDSSNFMLNKAKEKLNNSNFSSSIKESFHFVQSPIESYPSIKPSPFIICSLTLHFVPILFREEFIKKIHDSLEKGGAFLLVEKTFPQTPLFEHIFTHLLYDEKRQNGFNEELILKKEVSLRGVLNPLSTNEYFHLLKSIGFKVDIFFKEWNFTGFLAIKS